ncbi:phosphatase PAP2 family protein, partial [Streptomyces sp. KR55]|uniref:phosphatase PAP2 family protein n=1 Tax=Streptomyces sp. KR55 TaxID=3457425 RepID=UPI003FD166AF
RTWMKALGMLHPFFTLSAIVATGNHWVLDAVGGAMVVGAGFGLAYVFQGPRARTTVAVAEADAEPVAEVKHPAVS